MSPTTTRTHWHERWDEGRIGFHLSAPNRTLVTHVDALLDKGKRVLVPLAGKTLDMPFLADKGAEVVGVELVQKAVDEFFADLNATPHVVHNGTLAEHYSSGLCMVQGDFFECTPSLIGVFDAVWDRAALVALDEDTRRRYVAHLVEFVRPGGAILLVTLSYDQTKMEGPPFSVVNDEVKRLFKGFGTIAHLSSTTDGSQAPRLKEAGIDVVEDVWFIQRSME